MTRIILASLFALAITACNNQKPPVEDSTDTSMEKAQGAETAEIIGKEVTYESDTVVMKGYIAYSAGSDKPRPGIILFHEWWGHTDYIRQRADMLAELGYVAFAIDMYGDGKTASHPDDAGAFATAVVSNIDQSQAHMMVAYKMLEDHPMVKKGDVSAVGYCMGGSVALAMANKGVDFDGVAAFHAGVSLAVRPGAELTSEILIQNGGADPFIPEESVVSYKASMDQLNKPYTYISFPGVKHAYTNADADEIGKKFGIPLEYNAEADAKSWANMVDFFARIYPN